MPIYEYEAEDGRKSCEKCGPGFEVLQAPGEEPLSHCPNCGFRVRKIVSWCRAAIAERSEIDAGIERTLRDYEQRGMWNHAAEMADSHAEKTRDKAMRTRALENYKKAGYALDSLEKHDKSGFGSDK